MDDRQLRLGAGMLVALVLVAVIVQVWEPEEEPANELDNAVVWSVTPDDIARVEVDRREGRLVLVRDGEGWKAEAPFEGPADAWRARDLLNDAAGLARGFALEDAQDAEKYGLGDPPAAKIHLVGKDGATHDLWVGEAAPGRRRLYVRVPGGPIVAASGDINALHDPSDDFRDRTVLRFEVADVESARIEGPEGTLAIARRDDIWWLEGFARADLRKVEDLFLALKDLRFDKIADPTVVPVADGAFDLTLGLKGGGTLALHVEAPQEGEAALISTSAGLSGWVQADVLRFLGQGPSDIGDAAAFPIDLGAVKQVDMQLGDQSIVADRAGEGWTVGGAVDPRAIPAIALLRDATVYYRREPVPPISAPWGRIQVKTDAGERVYTVGPEVGGSFRVVQDSAGGAPYLVPIDQIAAVVAELAKK